MQRLNRKAGFSLVEVACTIGVLSIFITLIATIQLNNLKLRNYNKETTRYLVVLEAVKEEIVHNYTYEEMRQLSLADKRIIPGEILEVDNIKNKRLTELLSHSDNNKDTYLEMTIEDGEVLKIILEVHFILKSREEIYKCEIFKGNYI